ncbi:MAG: hypothetical protein GWM87_08245, partial [Xanthomonadales bacterium]|nr:hypothetical protein [Xanthomonadales bacterium]NIX12923.1 hypothetical protein [Xanthomonadales bacterium]
MIMKSMTPTLGLLVSTLSFAGANIGPEGIEGEARDRFEQLDAQDWQEVFFDAGTGDWRENWSLDGLKAEVT